MQTAIFLIFFLIMIIPVSRYIFMVSQKKATVLDPFMDRVDGGILRLSGISHEPMTWFEYGRAMILTNLAMMAAGYLILRLQSFLPVNPNGASGMSPDLAFNTAISFITNTNLQHYPGETGISYLSQMTVIIFMMFTSAASGYSVCLAFIRGITGQESLGNFYEDIVRVTTRILIPFSVLGGLILISQGVPQNFSQNLTVHTIAGKLQDIAMGPIASLEIIKHLGTNGGGFMGANSSSPLENPTVMTNMIEMLSMMLIPGSLVLTFGHMADETRKRRKSSVKKTFFSEAFPVFTVMAVIFLTGALLLTTSEFKGNPVFADAGLTSTANMEGKELRFGIEQSALFSNVTTSFTTGSVNNMHDSLTPLGGGVAMMNMMMNMVFGGKGVGLMNMLIYVILTVFICGLMIGRTPEYLGKKIEKKEMMFTALAIIVHPLLILAFSAIAVTSSGGLDGITATSHHGLSQVLYEYASSAANNGSGFEGLKDNTFFWNVTTGVVMFLGRFLPILLQLAVAGSLWRKKFINESEGSLKTATVTFTVSLLIVVVIFSALTFMPALVLGPLSGHILLWR